MSQLIMSSTPGFFDIQDAAIAGNQPLTDDSIQKLSHNAKFGAVRFEAFFMGYYTNGNVVGTPVSPVDGYAYARQECLMVPVHVSTVSPSAGFVPGQAAFPSLAANGGAGTILSTPFQMLVQPSTGTSPGAVTVTNYYSTTGQVSEGTVAVYCLAMRSSTVG
jgi:hypothetical protein